MSEILAGSDPLHLLAVFVIAYAIGSIPNAFLITRWVTGEDVTQHGTGNVGAMNVRRTTGSWMWFTVTMLADALKGLIPTAIVGWGFLADWLPAFDAGDQAAAIAAVLGTVLGHNYSAWMALYRRRFAASGKGLATGAGALLAYDWSYFLIVLAVGLSLIAVTRVMMAGQVGAAVSLPVYAIVSGQPDWPFVAILGAAVYLRHHRRFIGLLRGEEPKLYIEDGQGPRG